MLLYRHNIYTRIYIYYIYTYTCNCSETMQITFCNSKKGKRRINLIMGNLFLAHLVKTVWAFGIYIHLSFVVCLSHENCIVWKYVANILGMYLFRVVFDNPIFHSKWLPLLLIIISTIDHQFFTKALWSNKKRIYCFSKMSTIYLRKKQ